MSLATPLAQLGSSANALPTSAIVGLGLLTTLLLPVILALTSCFNALKPASGLGKIKCPTSSVRTFPSGPFLANLSPIPPLLTLPGLLFL
jgi:hypothetical protein